MQNQPHLHGIHICFEGGYRMDFILGQLKQLGMVAIVMLCATGGTVGILKLIKQLTPGAGFPKDPVSKKLEERQKEGE